MYPRVTLTDTALGVDLPDPVRSAAPPASTNGTPVTIPADQGSQASTAAAGPGDGPTRPSLRLEPVREVPEDGTHRPDGTCGGRAER